MPESRRPILNWKLAAVGVAALAAIGFLGVIFGRLIGETQIPPFAQIREIADLVASPLKKLGEDKPAADQPIPPNRKKFASVYFPIEATVAKAPPAKYPGDGGGIAWDGHDAIVIGNDGVLMAGRDEQIDVLDIAVPENGYAGYVQTMARPEYKDYLAAEFFLRYNNLLYVQDDSQQILLASYVLFHPERACFTNAISALSRPLSAGPVRTWKATAEEWKLVHETSPCLGLKRKLEALSGYASGGAMANAGDGAIYFASGDFQLDGLYGPDDTTAMPVAQQPEAEYGKVLRIDIESGKTSIVSLGHRNPQGMAVDSKGRVFNVEHGMAGGDELNLVLKGRNYGWPLETLGTQYTGIPMPRDATPGFHDKFESPTYAFLPSIGLAGLTAIENFHPTWEGDLLASSLKGQMLIRFRIRDNRVVFAERIHIGSRVRSVQQLGDGRIALWTDERTLMFLKPAEGGPERDFVGAYIDRRVEASPQVKQRVAAAIEACSQCHSLQVGNHQGAPSLAKIFGADIASTSFAGYSKALLEKSGAWTPEALKAFLANPQAAVPGTPMPSPNIADPAVIDGLVQVLDGLANLVEFGGD